MARVILALLAQIAIAANVYVLNHGSMPVELKKPKKIIHPGMTWKGSRKNRYLGDGAFLSLVQPSTRLALPNDRHVVVVFEGVDYFKVHDANALQIEFSIAAEKCIQERPNWDECLAHHTFGGFPKKAVSEAFADLWGGHDFWHTCTVLEPAKPLRTLTSKGGYKVNILREQPMVAMVREFVKTEVCESIMRTNDIKRLTRAHTGTGGGRTDVSEDRETLTANFFVDWGKKTALSVTTARKFDLVSELSGLNFSYEGQEPVNFLHYLKGYEYRPHMDGSGGAKGKRVATTLTYCEAAAEGGATIFTRGEPIRFQPRNGDLLFFAYDNPQTAYLSEHAACPVVAGNKTTLTQWYRPGVGGTKKTNWDNFEDWGKYHNPYLTSRWKGERYGAGNHHFEL